MSRAGLLARLDDYCDAVLRRDADVEAVGPLTVFTREGTRPSYARPTPGCRRRASVTVADVERVLTRQRELVVPEALEWIADLTPSLAPAARAAGLAVTDLPLLVLARDPTPPALPAGHEVGLLADSEHGAAHAVAGVAFASPGTAVGDVGLEAVAGRTASVTPTPGVVAAGGRCDGALVAVGFHVALGGVAEIAGVGTLPAFRRRGLGAAVTAALVADARRRGVATVFLTAGSEEIARVYERAGFERAGTAGQAEPPPVDFPSSQRASESESRT